MKQNKTFRDIFKWGDKREETVPKATLDVIKKVFNFGDDAFTNKVLEGNEELPNIPNVEFEEKHLNFFKELLGEENIDTSSAERINHGHGKYYSELLKLRLNNLVIIPNIVLYPRDENDVWEIVKYCDKNNIPVVPFGAGSSVTGSLAMPKGGVSIDITKHLNKVIEVNEVNSTVNVQAGIYGPPFEEYLNNYGGKYSCGHFPQSFEYSTVGGWIAAKGAGQASTGYGKIEDLVVSLKVVTPKGIIETKDYPAMAQGWDIFSLFIGSEGSLGVIVSATLKIFKHKPENTSYASFLFTNFETATKAMRKMMQSEYGKPHLFRISDSKETDTAFKMKSFDGTWKDKLMNMLGYKTGDRCLMFVSIEGEKDYTKFVKSKIKKTAKQHKAFYIGEKPVIQWLEQRYHSAYLRDPLMDLGIITDTVETAVTWDNMVPMWEAVHKYFASRPNTHGMSHISHVYPNGANIYLTFLSPMKRGDELEDYQQFYNGLIETIIANKGSLSHHHGVGRNLAPWMETQHGKQGMDLNKAIKNHLDSNNIMNPGGNLGLD